MTHHSASVVSNTLLYVTLFGSSYEGMVVWSVIDVREPEPAPHKTEHPKHIKY